MSTGDAETAPAAVAAVVLAHSQLTAEVWLKVVAYPALARVSAAPALPRADQRIVPDTGAGISAATRARNVAVAAAPLVGPASTKFAAGVSLKLATAGCAAVNTPVLDV